MFGKRIRLFTMLGFEIRIDLSWLIIAALLVWSLASAVFPYYVKGLAPLQYWGMAVAGALGFFASIILHELCHSLVARRFGMPMNGITLFLFGGVAEMSDEPASARAEFLMAAVGPLSSIVIGGVAYAFSILGYSLQWSQTITMVLRYLGGINILLALFNLIPAFPLDGGRILRAALWQWKGNIRWATRIAANAGSIFGILLMFWGFFSFILGSFIGGLWWILIGLFVRDAARMSYQSLIVRRYLEGKQVDRFMSSKPVSVPPSTRIDHLVDGYILKFHHKMFPVVDDHRVRCITVNEVKSIPQSEWPQHTVNELARPCSAENSIAAGEDAP
jgi:Zn-dependent protease